MSTLPTTHPLSQLGSVRLRQQSHMRNGQRYVPCQRASPPPPWRTTRAACRRAAILQSTTNAILQCTTNARNRRTTCTQVVTARRAGGERAGWLGRLAPVPVVVLSAVHCHHSAAARADVARPIPQRALRDLLPPRLLQAPGARAVQCGTVQYTSLEAAGHSGVSCRPQGRVRYSGAHTGGFTRTAASRAARTVRAPGADNSRIGTTHGGGGGRGGCMECSS